MHSKNKNIEQDFKMDKKINIQGVKMHNVNYVQTLSVIKRYLNSTDKKTICFISTHCVNIARKDIKYKSILNNFDLVLPDGTGIILAGLMNRTPIKENLNGTDLIPRLFNDLKQLRAFLLGAKPGVAEKAKINFEKKYKNIKIIGCMHGYFNKKKDISKLINKFKPDMILVAMGTPIQEKWIAKNKDKLNAKIIIAVGGLFDFIADMNKRAPKWMRKAGFEWLCRFYQEPRRMWKRYIIGNPSFLYYIFKDRMLKYLNIKK